LVNPYFRTREAQAALTALGVDVVLPPKQYLHADLPVLSPAIAGLIRRPSQLTLLDVGGDDVGATVLASLADALGGKRVHMLQVINPMRPFTETVQGCLKILHEIEKASKMKITGLIGNANLIDETTVADIVGGYNFVKEVSGRAELPLEFITVSVELLPAVDIGQFLCPLLPIERQLVPPWKKAVKLKI